MSKKAIFFDRDGTLNVDKGYIYQWKDFCWIDGAQEAIKHCNDLGYLVFVITNQSGVARGYYKETAIQNLHKKINENLSLTGAHVDNFEYCPHHPKAKIAKYKIDCPRRKPHPGMIISCLSNWNLSPENCFLVGNQKTDVEAAKAAGIQGFLFQRDNLFEYVKSIFPPF